MGEGMRSSYVMCEALKWVLAAVIDCSSGPGSLTMLYSRRKGLVVVMALDYLFTHVQRRAWW